MDFYRSRTVSVKSPVSLLAITMFALGLGSLFHNQPSLAADACPAPSFAAAPTLDAEGSVALGDFNGDGIPDLAVANATGVSVLLSNGDGTFQPAVNHNAGTNLVAVAVGDFNGDGRTDLAVADAGTFQYGGLPATYNGDGGVLVLLGNSDGTFQTPVKYGTAANPRSLAVGDFNGDGKLDLVVANSGLAQNHYGDGSVSVFLNKGNGTFGAGVRYGAGLYPGSVAVGDFNGDGKSDLAVANAGSRNVSVILGNGDGTFQAAVHYETGLGPYAVAVADFNGDGKPDLVVANFGAGGFEGPSGDVSVLLGNGDGTFRPSLHFNAGIHPYSVACGDFNKDGKPDLAVANAYSANISVLLGRGDGTFMAAVNYALGSWANSIVVADFNGDHYPDLAAGGDKVSLLLANGDGTFRAPLNYNAGMNSSFVVASDFNSDGKADLAVSDPDANNVSVLLGKGDGSFQVSYIPLGGGPEYIAVGDFNGDGKPDLALTSNPSTNVSVLLGNRDGTFQPAVNYAAGIGPRALAVADFNGDGKLDLAVVNHTVSGTVSVLLAKGDGTFSPAVSYGAAMYPVCIAAGDFNNDGKLDLAVAGLWPSNNVSVLLGNGDGTFQPAVNYTAGVVARPRAVAVADFNGDGKLDMVVGNFMTGDWNVFADISVLLGNGDGTFQTAINYETRQSTCTVAVSDFNGDGKPDLAFPGAVMLGNGDGTFQAAVRIEPSGISTAVGDFNGDGKPDLAVAQGDLGISVLLNTCALAHINPRPVAQSQAISVKQDTAAPITLFASDADNDALIYAVTRPAHGTLTGTPPNLVYQPALHYSGLDSFTFTVNDGKTNSAPATVSITVLQAKHTPSGRVVAWGNNYSGQSNVPSGLRDVVAVAGGWTFSMALRSDGTVVSWGRYPDFSQAYVPSGLHDVMALDGGAGHALALRSDGTVVAWGPANQNGQNSAPEGLSNVVAVAAGANHNVVLKSNGTVVSWGDPQFSATIPPAGLSNVVAVAAGGYHSLALKADGTVVAWGDNSRGESSVPKGLSNVVAVAAGWEHSLALRSDGSVVAWGINIENVTRVPPGVSNIVAIAAGDYHSLVMRADGRLFAWGYDRANGVVPVPAGLTNVMAIACGGDHNLVIVTNSAPIARPQNISINEDTSVAITLSAFDPDQDALTYTVTSPAYGMLSGAPPRLVYQPGTNYFGPDSFTFTVNDGEIDSAPATVSITVLPINDPPIADASATPTRVISPNNHDARVVLDGSRSHDIDNDSLQFSWFVDGATTASATGRVAVVVLSVGAHDVRLRVDDGQASDTNSVAVRVLTADDAVDELIAHMQAANLPHAHSLLNQLRAAERAIDDGAFDRCAHHLRLFQDKLRELQERNDVGADVASALLREAQAIIAVLSDTQHSPLAFTMCKCEKDGRVRLQFTGSAARAYLIEASTDLQTWVPSGVARERGQGEFEFEEAGAGLSAYRFYRILAP